MKIEGFSVNCACKKNEIELMEYNNLISVSGMSGLFELLTSKSDGAIARSLESNVTQFISSRAHQFSHLESIEVYTTRDNVFLAEVFIAMGKSKEVLPNEKDPKEVTAYFKKAFPNLDFERVYASDMKKMIKWFSQIQKNNIEPVLPTDEEDAEAAVVEAVSAPVVEAKKEPAVKAKKAAAPKDKTAK